MSLNEEQRVAVHSFTDPNASASTHEESLDVILEQVRNKQLSLELIVRNLGEVLTSLDDLVRSRGIQLVGEVLMQIPDLCMTPQNASTFAQFLAARLQDFPCVTQSIDAIHALVKHHKLHCQESSNTNPDLIVQALISELHIPSLRQPIRKKIYEILTILVTRYPAPMQLIGRDFVVGVIQAIDMEKDPRNLLVAFELVRATTQHLPVFQEFAEELFEVISCYFPISFRTTENDPEQAIGKEDLQNSLLETFRCTNAFARFSIPFLLEKMNSSTPDQKLECFQTLVACADTYHKRVNYDQFSHPFVDQFGYIWSVYRSELTSPSDSEFHRQCLQTLADLVESLSFDSVYSDSSLSPAKPHASVLQSFLTPVIRDCVYQIASPDVELARRTAIILSTCAERSQEGCVLIVKESLPIALQSLEMVEESHEQLIFVRILNLFLQATGRVGRDKSLRQIVATHLPSLWSVFTSFWTEATSSSLLRAAAVEGVQALQSIPSLLSVEQREQAIEQLTAIVVSSPVPGVDRSAQRASLEALVAFHQNEDSASIEEKTIPSLMQVVTHVNDNEEDWSDEEEQPDAPAYAMRALLRLATRPTTYMQVSALILDVLGGGSEAPRTELSSSFLWKQLGELVGQASSETLQQINWETVIPRTMELALQQAPSRSFAALVLSNAFQASQEEQQQAALEAYIRYFYQGTVPLGVSPALGHGHIPFGHTWNEDQATLLPLVVSLIVPAPAHAITTVFYRGQEEELTEAFFTASLSLFDYLDEAEPSQAKLLSAVQSRLVSTVVNKLHPTSALLGAQIQRIWDLPLSENEERAQRVMALQLAVLKSLCVRSDSYGWRALPSFCGMLHSKDLSDARQAQIVRGLGDVLDVAFEQENHFVIRLLYKQRYYHECKKVLFDPSQSMHEISSASLMALSTILSHLPEALMKQELPSLFPAIHQSLHSDHPTLLLSSVECVERLRESAPQLISEHINSLVTLLLRIAQFPVMNVRVQALETLGSFTLLPYHIVHPLQRQVTLELLTALDDRKRMVRRAAVRCRNEWLVMSADV